MSVLPSDTFLGKLEIVEVYEYYDQPVLFACRNAAQTHFLVVQLDARDNASVWLYVALSSQRFGGIRRGEIDLYDAFKQAEDELVYEVTLFNTSYPTQIRVLPILSLVDEQLPQKNEFLDDVSHDDRAAMG